MHDQLHFSGIQNGKQNDKDDQSPGITAWDTAGDLCNEFRWSYDGYASQLRFLCHTRFLGVLFYQDLTFRSTSRRLQRFERAAPVFICALFESLKLKKRKNYRSRSPRASVIENALSWKNVT